MARDNAAKARKHLPDTIPLLTVCRLPPCWRFRRYQQVGAGSEPAWDVVAELEADGAERSRIEAMGKAKHALMAPEIWWGEAGGYQPQSSETTLLGAQVKTDMRSRQQGVCSRFHTPKPEKMLSLGRAQGRGTPAKP